MNFCLVFLSSAYDHLSGQPYETQTACPSLCYLEFSLVWSTRRVHCVCWHWDPCLPDRILISLHSPYTPLPSNATCSCLASSQIQPHCVFGARVLISFTSQQQHREHRAISTGLKSYMEEAHSPQEEHFQKTTLKRERQEGRRDAALGSQPFSASSESNLFGPGYSCCHPLPSAFLSEPQQPSTRCHGQRVVMLKNTLIRAGTTLCS